MTETKAGDFNWELPMCGALGAIILVLPQMIIGNDAIALFATVALAAVIGLTLIAVALSKVRRHGLAVLGMVCIFLVLAGSLFRSSDYLRTTIRWLVHSQSYKTQVLNQPAPPDGSLKHIEWDGWGFAGVGDTTVYLVLDPSDGLAEAAKSHSPGRFSGIPCAIVGVRRLERFWYTVLFYTDTAWNSCI
jgi:hypothetical protein